MGDFWLKVENNPKFNNYKNVPSGAIMVYMNVPSSVCDRATRYTMQRFIIHGISYAWRQLHVYNNKKNINNKQLWHQVLGF